jgi:peptidyl-prolyl cis-trans isomerase SurA
MMKKIIAGTLFLSGSLISINNIYAQDKSDQVLMTIGNTKVKLSEFESVYHKNNFKDVSNDKKTLDDYIDLFTNFKLKVKEAEELGLDTTKQFRDELAGYRKQLAQPYLTDKDVNEKLLKEAYDRMQTDVRASHILIMVEEDALPKDTMVAYNKILKLRERALKGEDFAKLAREASEDPSAKENEGDLGYFSSLQMVYPFETMAYNTKVGEVSMPVRTRFGYHIIKVADKRKAQGEILVAHIMVKAGVGIPAQDSINAKAKIDEIYQKAKKGEDFKELAAQYSDDKGSAKKGGELPWFGTNRMPPEFEKASFALQENGEISAPMKTRFGWHIIKRINKKDVAKFDEVKSEIKGKISKDSRSQAGRASLIGKIKAEYKFKENLKARDEFYKVVDTTFFAGKWSADKAKSLNKPMFNLLDKNYTQTDFAKYLESQQVKKGKADIKQTVNKLYTQWVDESCVAFEESRLDQKYPEFKALMQEYRDGILLFELTDKKVWSKAIKDTTGLKDYYEKNKDKYMYPERADASVYTCADEKIAKDVRALIKKNKTESEILDQVNKASQLNLQIESKYFNKGENEFVDSFWKTGTSENKTADKKIKFVVVYKMIPPTPKSLNEAKGLVTSDYQNYLEKEWLESLRKKYPVTVDKTVRASIKE